MGQCFVRDLFSIIAIPENYSLDGLVERALQDLAYLYFAKAAIAFCLGKSGTGIVSMRVAYLFKRSYTQ